MMEGGISTERGEALPRTPGIRLRGKTHAERRPRPSSSLDKAAAQKRGNAAGRKDGYAQKCECGGVASNSARLKRALLDARKKEKKDRHATKSSKLLKWLPRRAEGKNRESNLFGGSDHGSIVLMGLSRRRKGVGRSAKLHQGGEKSIRPQSRMG